MGGVQENSRADEIMGHRWSSAPGNEAGSGPRHLQDQSLAGQEALSTSASTIASPAKKNESMGNPLITTVRSGYERPSVAMVVAMRATTNVRWVAEMERRCALCCHGDTSPTYYLVSLSHSVLSD